MTEDLFEPSKGEIWVHTESQKEYEVLGLTYNSITDEIDVRYKPLYPCEYKDFTRQMRNHPKAWFSPNKLGWPRFELVRGAAIPDAINCTG